MLGKCLAAITNTCKLPDYELMVVKNDFVSFAHAVNRVWKYAVSNPDIGGVFVVIDDFIVEDPDWWRLAPTLSSIRITVPPQFYREDHVVFGCSYFPITAISYVGLLDERFTILEAEDVDWCARAQEKGVGFLKYGTEVGQHLEFQRYSQEQKDIKKRNKDLFDKKWKGTKWEGRLCKSLRS